MPTTRPRRIPRPTSTRPTSGVEASPQVVRDDDESPGTTSEAVAGDMAVALAVEVVGTFLLVFAAVASIVVTRANEVTGAALAAGLATGVLVASLGHLSAALFNPAIAVAFAVTGRLSPARAGIAVIGQAVGAVLGSGAVAFTFAGTEGATTSFPSVPTSATTRVVYLLPGITGADRVAGDVPSNP